MPKRTYPLSLAVTQAKHVAQEKHLGPLCVNAVDGKDLDQKVTIEVIDQLVELMLSDTRHSGRY